MIEVQLIHTDKEHYDTVNDNKFLEMIYKWYYDNIGNAELLYNAHECGMILTVVSID